MPDDTIRVPIIEEDAHVAKHAVPTDRVTVRTVPEEEQILVREEVRRETVEVRRVPINQQVDRAPVIREEGDVTIIPVLEERLMVEKRLFLVEEVHVVRSLHVEPVEVPATLKHTRVDIAHTDLTKQQEEDRGNTR